MNDGNDNSSNDDDLKESNEPLQLPSITPNRNVIRVVDNTTHENIQTPNQPLSSQQPTLQETMNTLNQPIVIESTNNNNNIKITN